MTGSARSGTTLAGTLIHSMRGVEYSFEPATLTTLFLHLDRIPVEAWKLIYESYVFEELMLNGLAGRFMNLNPHDDSSILRAKPYSEVFGRFEKSGRFASLFDEGLQRTIAYKLPNVVSRIPLLRQIYPATRAIVMLRHPDPVVNSMDRKGWYVPSPLSYRDCGILSAVDGQLVPPMLPESDARNG
ncbi:MAG: sulfotransferase [Chthoniobacter sp.]